MVAPREVVARLRADRLRVRVLVGALRERERLRVLAAVKVVVGEVVEDGGVVRLELVGLLEHLEGGLDAVLVQVQHRQPHHRVDVLLVQLERPLERLPREARLAELVVAVAEAEADDGGRRRVDAEDLAVELERLAEVPAVELRARLPQQRRHRVAVEVLHLRQRLLGAPELAARELQHGAADVGGALEEVDVLGGVVVALRLVELRLLPRLVALARAEHRVEGASELRISRKCLRTSGPVPKISKRRLLAPEVGSSARSSLSAMIGSRIFVNDSYRPCR